MDVRTEDLNTACLVPLEKGRTGEPDEGCVRQNGLHGLVELSALSAVALVDEDKEVAFRFKARRQGLLHLFDEVRHVRHVSVVIASASELVNKRADQPLFRLVERGDQVGPAAGAVDLLVDPLKDFLDLVVKVSAVG